MNVLCFTFDIFNVCTCIKKDFSAFFSVFMFLKSIN